MRTGLQLQKETIANSFYRHHICVMTILYNVGGSQTPVINHGFDPVSSTIYRK